MKAAVKRAPTFFVSADKQKGILDEFQRREQHLTEEYQKNKPLCLSARAFQQTHPAKVEMGYKDADATLTSPMLLGVCDGVSQLEEFNMDPSLLPHELLKECEELATTQLMPDRPLTGNGRNAYKGPIALLKEAYLETESMGSTTVLLAALDNSTRIHGKLHPMIAVLSIGDCELLMLRRTSGRQSELEAVFHTEMQRIDYNVQTPLQLARVDARIDQDFDESVALEVIEEGSAVHCVSAYEGDMLILGSDGVFDNLFLDEIVAICNHYFKPAKPGSDHVPIDPSLLREASERIVKNSHGKSDSTRGIFADAPIGKGGKVDDTSVIVAEVVEWTDAHREICNKVRARRRRGHGGSHSSFSCTACEADEDEFVVKPSARRGQVKSEKTLTEEESDSGSDSVEENSGTERACTLQ
jgi:protein phosphatase PTC7